MKTIKWLDIKELEKVYLITVTLAYHNSHYNRHTNAFYTIFDDTTESSTTYYNIDRAPRDRLVFNEWVSEMGDIVVGSERFQAQGVALVALHFAEFEFDTKRYPTKFREVLFEEFQSIAPQRTYKPYVGVKWEYTIRNRDYLYSRLAEALRLQRETPFYGTINFYRLTNPYFPTMYDFTPLGNGQTFVVERRYWVCGVKENGDLESFSLFTQQRFCVSEINSPPAGVSEWFLSSAGLDLLNSLPQIEAGKKFTPVAQVNKVVTSSTAYWELIKDPQIPEIPKVEWMPRFSVFIKPYTYRLTVFRRDFVGNFYNTFWRDDVEVIWLEGDRVRVIIPPTPSRKSKEIHWGDVERWL